MCVRNRRRHLIAPISTAVNPYNNIAAGALRQLRAQYAMTAIGKDVQISGYPGKKVIGEGTSDSGDLYVITTAITTSTVDYIFLLVAPKSSAKSANRLYDVMIPTIRFLK